jgi:hypothetical protein
LLSTAVSHCCAVQSCFSFCKDWLRHLVPSQAGGQSTSVCSLLPLTYIDRNKSLPFSRRDFFCLSLPDVHRRMKWRCRWVSIVWYSNYHNYRN